MSELYSVTGNQAVYTPPTSVSDRASEIAQPSSPADHLLEQDVVTNNIPRLTSGRQAQAGSAVINARLRDSRELSRSRKPGTSSLGLIHPLLPDPETHESFHDFAAHDVTPQHISDMHAQALALALQKLSPQQQNVVMRAMQARQTGTLQRQASARSADVGRARMRAPGTGVQKSLFDPESAINDQDAVESNAPQYRPLAETMQSKGANPFVELLDRQRTVDAATQARLYLGSRVNDGADHNAFARFASPRTPLEHVMHQASTISERESRLNQMLIANSRFESDPASQARRFRSAREADPITHKVLGQLINQVGGLHDDAARESEIVALLGKVHPGQTSYINDLAVHLQSVQNPALREAGEQRLQALTENLSAHTNS